MNNRFELQNTKAFGVDLVTQSFIHPFDKYLLSATMFQELWKAVELEQWTKYIKSTALRLLTF